MKLRLLAWAAVAALCSAGAAQAATIITFDNPGVIDIIGNTAIYTESGYTISGQAADFLPLNNALVGGFFGAQSFSLKAVGGGAFSLMSLDFAYFDLGDTPGNLTITALRGGVQVAASIVSLATPGTIFITGPWLNVNTVTFSATSGFSLDNIGVSAVPEPGSLAFMAAGLAALGASRVRRRLIG